jgi:L-2-hydroxyglutarate oxidase LhgO
MEERIERVDVCVIGAGISGAGVFHLLSRYSDLDRVALVEKEPEVAALNSRSDHNSQTLHLGDIETNYDLDKSREVKAGAELLEAFLTRHGDADTHRRVPKMALAIGEAQIARLRERFEAYQELYPNLEWLERDAIAPREPLLVDGRPDDEPIAAIYNPRGLAVDFGGTANLLFERARRDADPGRHVLHFGDGVAHIARRDDGYRVTLESGARLDARALAVNAGGDSLRFAQSLGLAPGWGLVMVGGDWYLTRSRRLGAKVYTMQEPGLPFAAVHGDPDVHDPATTRFGPSAVIVLLMERARYASLARFVKTAGVSVRWVLTCLQLLFSSWRLLRFNLLNMLYTAPWIGRRLFARRIRRIVPSLRVGDLEPHKLQGGVRPQVVDLDAGELDFGEKKVHGERAVFVITPSPGASISLSSALEDARELSASLDARFDEERFLEDIGLEEHRQRVEEAPLHQLAS